MRCTTRRVRALAWLGSAVLATPIIAFGSVHLLTVETAPDLIEVAVVLDESVDFALSGQLQLFLAPGAPLLLTGVRSGDAHPKSVDIYKDPVTQELLLDTPFLTYNFEKLDVGDDLVVWQFKRLESKPGSSSLSVTGYIDQVNPAGSTENQFPIHYEGVVELSTIPEPQAALSITFGLLVIVAVCARRIRDNTALAQGIGKRRAAIEGPDWLSE